MLFVTLGDPLSVNCEILGPLLSRNFSYPVIVIGSKFHWQQQTNSSLVFNELSDLDDDLIISLKDSYYFYDINFYGKSFQLAAELLTVEQRGLLAIKSLEALQTVKELAKCVLLTAPISKQACAQAGFSYRGQTEYFADLYRCPTIMLLSCPQLHVGLATNHIAIKELPKTLSEKLLVSKITLLANTLQQLLAISEPRLAVCGLNPHCGEQGLYGDEEQRLIIPAIKRCQQQGLKVTGPLAGDTVFHLASKGRYDGVLAMYHDQGLAAIKTFDFYQTVNITGGLPVLRLSPDHGPAADLYQQQQADNRSFARCLELADRYLLHEFRT